MKIDIIQAVACYVTEKSSLGNWSFSVCDHTENPVNHFNRHAPTTIDSAPTPQVQKSFYLYYTIKIELN